VAELTALVVLAAGRARRYGGVKPLAPIGPAGEAVIDLLAGDALRAGFGEIVLVVNPDTGSLIREHVASAWPGSVDVRFAVQERPLGTVHAVLAAHDAVERSAPFGVANADDLYGGDALRVLGQHLEEHATNCLVGFRLDNALVGDLPVTRGVCTVADGNLVSIAERRHVRLVDGTFRSLDGRDPEVLDPSALVSMNLWGFAPQMWEVLARAMADATEASEDNEVLLPELVSNLVGGIFPADEGLRRCRVLATQSRCIGVTHADDLALVRSDIAEQVARGERPLEAFPA
jgi:hypothetical protein